MEKRVSLIFSGIIFGILLLLSSASAINAPKIKDITPHNAPASIEYPFSILIENASEDLTYIWDFGDNSSKVTGGKTMKHKYSKTGIYNLKVVVKGDFGNLTKTVEINVSVPKEQINYTINEYNSRLNNIENKINKLPEWIKKEILKEIDLNSLRNQIKIKESEYESALLDEDYLRVMNSLMQLDIPILLETSQKINPSPIIPNPSQINLPALEYFGAGSTEIKRSEEDYTNAITVWLNENLNIKINSETYTLYYASRAEDLYSYVNIILSPKTNLERIYFLINGAPNQIKVNGKTENYDDAVGVVFDSLIEDKNIEFLYPGKIDIENLPFYISPEFTELKLEPIPEVCNYNSRCEKELGENYKNCRNDCKPILKTIIYILFLILGALIVYIVLQEWYKRHYENYLFKDKNQLFNLINFMSISTNQGISKSEIFKKLKKHKWKREQINYAWNKFKGKRTGMWEIPIFKWIENRKVKMELEKRQNLRPQKIPNSSNFQ